MNSGQEHAIRVSPGLCFMKRFANPIVCAILRSPLHGILSHALLLLTYTGKKSGRTFTIPTEYVTGGEAIYILVPGSFRRIH